MAALGFHCCSGYSLVVVCWLLIGVASPVAEHRLWGAQTLVVAALGL